MKGLIKFFSGFLYSAEPLEAELSTYLGRHLLYGASLSPRVAVVAAHRSGKSVRPSLFASYHRKYDPSLPLIRLGAGVHDAARATSAAPTYLPLCNWRNEQFADGGVVANNPSKIALLEAQALWTGARCDVLLSLGTGRCDMGIPAFTNNMILWAKICSSIVTDTELTWSPRVPHLPFRQQLTRC